MLCHSSTLIHSGLSTNEREVIRTSCPVYSGALFNGREKLRFAEVNQKLLLGLEICARLTIASTPLCVCACVQGSHLPPVHRAGVQSLRGDLRSAEQPG